MRATVVFCVVAIAFGAADDVQQGTFDAPVPTYEQRVQPAVDNDLQGASPIVPSVLIGQEEEPAPVKATHKILTTEETTDETVFRPEQELSAESVEEASTTTSATVPGPRPVLNEDIATFNVQPLVPLQLAFPDAEPEEQPEEAEQDATLDEATETDTTEAAEVEQPVGEEAEVAEEQVEVVDDEADVIDEEQEAVDGLEEVVDEQQEVLDEQKEVVDEQQEVVDDLEGVVDEQEEIIEDLSPITRARRQVTYGANIDAPAQTAEVLPFDARQFYTNNQQLVEQKQEEMRRIEQPRPIESVQQVPPEQQRPAPTQPIVNEQRATVQVQPTPMPVAVDGPFFASNDAPSTDSPQEEPTEEPSMPRIEIPPNSVCLLPLEHPCNSRISACICSEGMFCEYGRCALETGFATVDVYRAPTPKFVQLAQPEQLSAEINAAVRAVRHL